MTREKETLAKTDDVHDLVVGLVPRYYPVCRNISPALLSARAISTGLGNAALDMVTALVDTKSIASLAMVKICGLSMADHENSLDVHCRT